MRTPWGDSDYEKEYAEGITFYGTPSHGGFKLSPDRVKQIPESLRGLSGYPQSWYEEDCSYAAVVFTFPEAFVGDEAGMFPTATAASQHAAGVLARWYPEELAKVPA